MEKKTVPITHTTSSSSSGVGSSKRVHVVEVLVDQRVNDNKVRSVYNITYNLTHNGKIVIF